MSGKQTGAGDGTGDRLEEFRQYRLRMNERIASANHLGINRFFNLDTTAYYDGALPGRTKELLGLVASAVLTLRRLRGLSPHPVRRSGLHGRGDNGRAQRGTSSRREHSDTSLRHAMETIDLLRAKEKGQ